MVSENGLLVLPNALHTLGIAMGGEVRYWQKIIPHEMTKQPLVKAQV